MAGVENALTLNTASSEKAARAVVDLPAVSYGRAFAESRGQGPKESEAYSTLTASCGEGQAACVRAMCWFLHWGSHTGNTLNGIVGRKPLKEGTSLFFKVTFAIYYGILFWGVVTPVSFLVSKFPQVPSWFSAAFGVVLITTASIWMVPLGLIATLLRVETKAPLANQ
eukprot:TRINITY_DN48293_c0_g1_i1.p1 TRINITY_DN48293_c0_g1~~TRINITY_DN48293_c0_g1_i1.p1  ORF type:complete len:168 (-),score=23.73 TRINITY_DN48293_c0_g1_i1:93-596(-)